MRCFHPLRVWFQSTHPRRVRLLLNQIITFTLTSFNPRTHVGCDCRSYLWKCLCSSFNPRTHVGCDFLRLVACVLQVCFNPRTHVGCDPSFLISQSSIKEFQSTHPRRVRHPFEIEYPRDPSFNPRTHVGCDSCAIIPS